MSKLYVFPKSWSSYCGIGIAVCFMVLLLVIQPHRLCHLLLRAQDTTPTVSESSSSVVVLSPLPPTADSKGFFTLFNGKDLTGWDGNPDIWSVQDGCIVGQTTEEETKKLKYNQFLIFKDREFSDFVLCFDIKLSEKGNSGVQYRSWRNDDPAKSWSVFGYQADIDGSHRYSGILYGENYRGILAMRGQETCIEKDHKPKVVREFAVSDDLKKDIKVEDWNHYEVTAKDFTFTQKINGKLTCIVTDNDIEQRRDKGIIAIQSHVGPAMKVEVRNIRIKPL